MTTSSLSAGATPAQAKYRRVVDAPTRVFHWLFALSFLGAYLTSEGERFRLLHVVLGYTMAGLLVFRVAYGLLGPRQAGLMLLWRKIASLGAWVQAQRLGLRTPGSPAVNWRQGQNLFVALTVLALLAMVLPLTLSGYATYNEWGDALGGDWIEEVHELLGNTVLALVLAHGAAIVGLSVLRRKNLVAPMVTGRADGPGPDLAKRNHLGLAALLLCAVLAYWAWEWQQSPQGLLSAQSIGAALREQDDDDD